MVHFAGLGGLDHEADARPGFGAHEVMVNRTGCHRDGHADVVDVGSAVAENDDVGAVVDGGVDRIANPVERRPNTGRSVAGAIQRRDDRRLEACVVGAIVERRQLTELGVGEHRVLDDDLLARLGRALEDVALGGRSRRAWR